MKLKKVLLFGGIGNQLFQLSRAYQHKLDGKNVALINIQSGKSIIYNFLNLTQHNDWIDMCKLSSLVGIECKRISLKDAFFIIYVFFQKRLSKKSNFNTQYDYNSYLPIDIGYFQSRKHVSLEAINKVAELLLDYLSIKNKNPINDFTIHIRGSNFDAAKREHIQFTSPQDVQRAIKFSKKNNISIKIVTNSKKDAIKVFPSASEDNFSNGKNELEDFKILCLSKNLFLSNSTFSFWAYLCAKKLYLSEVNSIPGFTEISMFPKLLEHDGIKYSSVINELIKYSIYRYKKEKKLSKSLS